MRRTLPLLFVAAASSLPVGVGGGVINVSKMPHRKPGNTYTQARRHHTHAGARAHAHDLCCACTCAPARVLVARHLSLRAPRWRPRTRRRPLARSRRLMPSGTAPPCDADARVHARHILAGAGRYGSAHTPWCQRRDSTAPAGGIALFTHSSHPARRAAAKPGAALRRLHGTSTCAGAWPSSCPYSPASATNTVLSSLNTESSSHELGTGNHKIGFPEFSESARAICAPAGTAAMSGRGDYHGVRSGEKRKAESDEAALGVAPKLPKTRAEKDTYASPPRPRPTARNARGAAAYQSAGATQGFACACPERVCPHVCLLR